MDSAFAAVPGAVVADDDAVTPGVVLHLGNPLAEQRQLARGKAVAPLDDRAVIAVSGVDRLGWLDSVTSQALASLQPGESTELLVLDPQGHIEHAAGVVDDVETTWLIVDAADADSLATWLTRMKFRMRVEIRRADELSVIGAVTDADIDVSPVAPAGIPLVWRDPWPGVSVGGHGYAQGEHPGRERAWVEILVGPEERSRIAAEAVSGDRIVVGTLAAEALRIAAWRPRWSRDVDERSLPHELDWLRTAVHLNKGCYRGQETVAKVHNLGHPPRRIVGVHLDGADSILPAPGAELVVGDVAIGTLTSVAWHGEDGPIGLAVVRRTVPEGDVVVITDEGPVAASIETIVPPEAGAAASVPRLPRLSRRAPATPPAAS